MLYRLNHQGSPNTTSVLCKQLLEHSKFKVNFWEPSEISFPWIFIKKLIIYLIWLCWVLAAACRIFDLRCGTWTLSYCMWYLVPGPGIGPGPPASGVQSLSQWTTKEVLPWIFLIHTWLYVWMGDIFFFHAYWKKKKKRQKLCEC